MSYILDALRKSDELRQRGVAPLLQPALSTPPARRWHTYTAYGVLGALLVGAGMVIGGLRPWQPEPSVAGAGGPAVADIRAGGSGAPVPPAVAPPAELSGSPADAGSAAPVPANAILTPSAPASAAIEQSSPAGRANTPAAKITAATAKAQPPVGPMRRAEGMPETGVLSQSELPPAIRQEIPAMSISVHAYSARPQDRMVGINDRLLREGGALPPGLTLDEITPEGMIFSYKGYRFKRGLSELGVAAGSR